MERQAYWEAIKQKYENRTRTLQQKEMELRHKLEAMDAMIGTVDSPPNIENIQKKSFAAQPSFNFPNYEGINSNERANFDNFKTCTCPEQKGGFFQCVMSMFGSSKTKAPEDPPTKDDKESIKSLASNKENSAKSQSAHYSIKEEAKSQSGNGSVKERARSQSGNYSNKEEVKSLSGNGSIKERAKSQSGNYSIKEASKSQTGSCSIHERAKSQSLNYSTREEPINQLDIDNMQNENCMCNPCPLVDPAMLAQENQRLSLGSNKPKVSQGSFHDRLSQGSNNDCNCSVSEESQSTQSSICNCTNFERSYNKPERNSSAVEPRRNSSLAEARRNSSVVEPRRNSSVVEPGRNSIVVESARNSLVCESGRNSTVCEQGRNSLMVELERNLLESDRNSVVVEPDTNSVVAESGRNSITIEPRTSPIMENSCMPCSPSSISLKSMDLFYMKNIHDLVEEQKAINKQVEALEKKAQIYENVFKEYGNINLSKSDRCICNERNISSGLGDPKQKTAAELKLENVFLQTELRDMRLEVRQYLERMEGPMMYKIESEKFKSRQLEEQLDEAIGELKNMRANYEREMNTIKMQLCNANANIYAMTKTNDELKAELEAANTKCATLEDNLIRQKISEAETLKSLKAALEAQNNAGIVKEECNLHEIARELSKILKECEPCGECVTLPEDLTTAARLLKSLTDMVDRKLPKTKRNSIMTAAEVDSVYSVQATEARRKSETLRATEPIEEYETDDADDVGETGETGEADEVGSHKEEAKEVQNEVMEISVVSEVGMSFIGERISASKQDTVKSAETPGSKRQSLKSAEIPAEIAEILSRKSAISDTVERTSISKPESSTERPGSKRQSLKSAEAPESKRQSLKSSEMPESKRQSLKSAEMSESKRQSIKSAELPGSKRQSLKSAEALGSKRQSLKSAEILAEQAEILSRKSATPSIKTDTSNVEHRKSIGSKSDNIEFGDQEPGPTSDDSFNIVIVRKGEESCSCMKTKLSQLSEHLDQLWPETPGERTSIAVSFTDEDKPVEKKKKKHCECANKKSSNIVQEQSSKKVCKCGRSKLIEEEAKPIKAMESGDSRKVCKCGRVKSTTQEDVEKPVEIASRQRSSVTFENAQKCKCSNAILDVENMEADNVDTENMELVPTASSADNKDVDQLWPTSSERFRVSHQVTASKSQELLKSETSVKCLKVEENFPFEVDTQVDVLDRPPDGVHITTTITNSGTLEVITEGPDGVIETTLIYTDSGNVEVVTDILKYDKKTKVCNRGRIRAISPPPGQDTKCSKSENENMKDSALDVGTTEAPESDAEQTTITKPSNCECSPCEALEGPVKCSSKENLDDTVPNSDEAGAEESNKEDGTVDSITNERKSSLKSTDNERKSLSEKQPSVKSVPTTERKSLSEERSSLKASSVTNTERKSLSEEQPSLKALSASNTNNDRKSITTTSTERKSVTTTNTERKSLTEQASALPTESERKLKKLSMSMLVEEKDGQVVVTGGMESREVED